MRYRSRKKLSLPAIVLRIIGAVFSVLIIFIVVRMFLGSRNIPSLHADELRMGFETKKTLIAKINELQNTIDTYKTATELAPLLQEENATLKAELGRAVSGDGVLARVLTGANRNFYNTIVIDAGTLDGISEGMTVYAFDAIALGTVTDVKEHRAVAQLFSAGGTETAGTAEGSDISLTLIGRGGGEYEVHMPRDVQFSIGEAISYQSTNVAILAKIEKIITDPRDPFQRLLAKAPVNLNALKFVIVK